MKESNRSPQSSGRSTRIVAILGNTPRLLKLVWEAAPGWLVLSVFLTLTSSLVPVAQLYISKLIVDQVVALVRAGGVAAFTSHLISLVAAGFGLTVLGSVLQQSSKSKRVLEPMPH